MKYLILFFSFSAFGSGVAIRNFREIYESFQVSTNISPAPDHPIKVLYDQVFEILPTSGAVGEYNVSMQWALFKLASEFCRERIQMDSKLSNAERWVHREIDFSKSPGNNPKLLSVLNDYAELFWQRGVTADEKAELDSLVSTMAGELPNAASSLTPLLTCVCTVVATSIQSLVIE